MTGTIKNIDSRQISNDPKTFFCESIPLIDFTRHHQVVQAKLLLKMDRGFFLVNDYWTCYRRNYFQISCGFEFLDSLQNMEDLYYNDTKVMGMKVRLHSESVQLNRDIELIQHTTKRDKGPTLLVSDMALQPGGNPYNSNICNSLEHIAIYERVQFKVATPNNGKRNATHMSQQNYILVVDLYCILENQEIVKAASCSSSPLVVRGRSPGHFKDHQATIYQPYTQRAPETSATFRNYIIEENSALSKEANNSIISSIHDRFTIGTAAVVSELHGRCRSDLDITTSDLYPKYFKQPTFILPPLSRQTKHHWNYSPDMTFQVYIPPIRNQHSLHSNTKQLKPLINTNLIQCDDSLDDTHPQESYIIKNADFNSEFKMNSKRHYSCESFEMTNPETYIRYQN
jgi:hypothetical protein